MLIFTKKIGETFATANYATVTVLDIQKDQVKLGIDSPAAATINSKAIDSHIKTIKSFFVYQKNKHPKEAKLR